MVDQEPNYKVIELQAENDHLKDDIIRLLKEKIVELERELSKYKVENIIYEKEPEIDVSSHMIDPRPVLRTMSEISKILEQKSILMKDKLTGKVDVQ